MNSISLNLMDLVADKYIVETMPHKVLKDPYSFINRYKRILKSTAVICTTFVIFILVGINFVSPVFARSLPFLGSAFAYIQDNLDFAGIYTNYAFEIGDTAIDQNITIQLSEGYCDGKNLCISFLVKSEIPFSQLGASEYLMSQLYYNGKAYITHDGNKVRLEEYGIEGLEGTFVDEYTFVGVETYSMELGDFPEHFEFDMTMDHIGVFNLQGNDVSAVSGKWKFHGDVLVDKSLIKIIDVNVKNRGHSIDQVVVSPVMILLYTSYPDIYDGTVDYYVVVYSDIYDEWNICTQGYYEKTSGVDKIPKSRAQEYLDVYVLDESTLTKHGIERHKREEIEKHAIVSTRVYIE